MTPPDLGTDTALHGPGREGTPASMPMKPRRPSTNAVALGGKPLRFVYKEKALNLKFDIYAARLGTAESAKVAIVFNNITNRSRLERKTREQAQDLAELHLRKDQFLAMLSHELRNPLAPLGSAVQLLRRQKIQASLQQQALNIIERQVDQLKHLIDDLLGVSRITSGSIRLRREPVSVQEIVQMAVETTQPLVLRQRHELAVSLPLQTVWLPADPTRLEQVLANAIKYTDEGGRIWLSVELEGAGETAAPLVLVKVRANGIGIAPELLPRIFDLFTQAERSIDRSQGGLGIGLSLVRQLVELHAGMSDGLQHAGAGPRVLRAFAGHAGGHGAPAGHVVPCACTGSALKLPVFLTMWSSRPGYARFKKYWRRSANNSICGPRQSTPLRLKPECAG